MDLSGCERNRPDRRETRLQVRGHRPVVSVQEVLQAVLQRWAGGAGGVDELRVQVERPRRGPADEVSAAARLQAGLQDLAELRRAVLHGARKRQNQGSDANTSVKIKLLM